MSFICLLYTYNILQHTDIELSNVIRLLILKMFFSGTKGLPEMPGRRQVPQNLLRVEDVLRPVGRISRTLKSLEEGYKKKIYTDKYGID